MRLTRLDTTPAARWTLVLAAEQAQAARWSDSLRVAVDLRIELAHWSAEDTVGYVQTALVDVGRMEPVFLMTMAGAHARTIGRRATASGAVGRLRTAGRRGREGRKHRRCDDRSGV